MVLSSPAKLNLALRVIAKRKDGFHELVTLFHLISLKDTLVLQKQREGIHLFCSHPRVPERKNLIIRAFYLLKAERPFKGGVTVRLTKRIPVGGGLGGGSSNAAAFLVGMNRMYRLGLSRNRLMKLGEKLGSDIPFFVSGISHGMGWGKGERIKPLPFKRKLGFILFPSERGLSTREVYSGSHLTRSLALTRVKRDVKMASAFLEKGKLVEASRFLTNDLTKSAEHIRPSIKKTREILSGLQLGTCQMSGSGPTLFIFFFHSPEGPASVSSVTPSTSIQKGHFLPF